MSGFERARLRPSSVTPERVTFTSGAGLTRVLVFSTRASRQGFTSPHRPKPTRGWEIQPDRRLQSIYRVVKGGLDCSCPAAVRRPEGLRHRRQLASAPHPRRNPSLPRAVPTVHPRRNASPSSAAPERAASSRSRLWLPAPRRELSARAVRRHLRHTSVHHPNELSVFDSRPAVPKNHGPLTERGCLPGGKLPGRSPTHIRHHRW
jgi:hypothetical protein